MEMQSFAAAASRTRRWSTGRTRLPPNLGLLDAERTITGPGSANKNKATVRPQAATKAKGGHGATAQVRLGKGTDVVVKLFNY